MQNRVLLIEAALSESAFQVVRNGLPGDAKAGECFFATFAYADIPLPKTFDVVYDIQSPARKEVAPVTIKAAAQQFATPLKEIPHGWKTICWIEHNSPLLHALPSVDAWYKNPPSVGLCSHETWDAKISRS